MTALTEDRNTKAKQGGLFAHSVAATKTIYNGAMVNRDVNGYATPASDTVSHMFMGVASEQADNVTGANGDLTIQGKRDGVFLFAANGLDQGNVGDDLYVVDDQTVGLGIVAQPVNVTGVVLKRAPSTRGAASVTLVYTNTGTTLAFGGGTAVDVSGSGTFVLTGTDGNQIIAEVTAGSLPVSDQNDSIQLRHVRAGVCESTETASSVWVDISGATRK